VGIVGGLREERSRIAVPHKKGQRPVSPVSVGGHSRQKWIVRATSAFIRRATELRTCGMLHMCLSERARYFSENQKFYFPSDPNHFITPAVPAHTEGRFAIVTDVGQGMRWTRAAPETRALICGRRSRVVLTPRRWRQVGGSDSAGDGGKKARSPGRARYRPLKPSRAGMPGVPVRPW
jgi:hypothetical protein